MSATVSRNPDDLLDVKAVRARLLLGKSAVLDLLAKGRIPHMRLGAKTIRVRQGDLDAYLDGLRQQSVQAVH